MDIDLLDSARRAHAAVTDGALIDASYAAYDQHPVDEPDVWGDLASFRRTAVAT